MLPHTDLVYTWNAETVYKDGQHESSPIVKTKHLNLPPQLIGCLRTWAPPCSMAYLHWHHFNGITHIPDILSVFVQWEEVRYVVHLYLMLVIPWSLNRGGKFVLTHMTSIKPPLVCICTQSLTQIHTQFDSMETLPIPLCHLFFLPVQQVVNRSLSSGSIFSSIWLIFPPVHLLSASALCIFSRNRTLLCEINVLQPESIAWRWAIYNSRQWCDVLVWSFIQSHSFWKGHKLTQNDFLSLFLVHPGDRWIKVILTPQV